jgi:rubrerythrin
MNTVDLLYDVLQDKLANQRFYNEAMLSVINPSARELFKKLRDEEERHSIILQQEILAIEAKPFPINKFLGFKKEKYISNIDINNSSEDS